MRTLPTRRRWLPALLVVLLAACDVVAAPALPGQTAAQPTSQSPPGATPAAAAPAPTTPPAPDLLARALRARQLGDYDAAALDLRALLDTSPAAPEARPATFYLAESFGERGRWTSALETLRGFLADGPHDDLYARGLFLMGRGYEGAGAFADAVATYERYRALNTPLEPYARLRQAAQEQALGRAADAAASYEAAASTAIVRGERAGAYEKAIALRRQLGQDDAALALYRRLLDLADAPDYRARVLGDAAALAAQAGAPDDARAWWRELAEHMPETPQALDAVARLAETGAPGLDPAAAARVYSAHEQWAGALPAYDAAIAASAGEPALELRRQRALARRATGDFAGAQQELAAVGAESPDGEAGRQAQLDWVQTKGQAGDTQGAIQGYREFAQVYPDDQRAPEALSRAAILLARLGDAEGALQQQLDLGRRYPASEPGRDGLYEAGWSLYRAGRMDEARAALDLLRRSAPGVVAAQAAFWAAHTLDPQSPDYAALLDAAAAAAPDSYYGARAAELRGTLVAGTTPVGAPIDEAAWRAAEDWLAAWSGRPAYRLAERGYPPEVAQDGAVARAIALQDVGLHPESIAEWNQARDAWRDDPQKLYLLARLAHERDAAYVALKAAEDIARLSPDKSAASAPVALRRLIFPTPYAALVPDQARAHGLEPLALYALLRQESLFDPGATSWAGARGLAQVMPATAAGIAQNLQVAEFHEDDLYRPAVSIRFGAFYLGHQQDLMEGSLAGALAAYNGGPGNAQRWAGGTAVADQDLFAEGIDYDETRGYVKLVYGAYGAYRRLYQVK
ncbi:MAG: transglycosylase SLT domain-containing protein [Kouleothrix sp.]|nr:transglycosylase SLT domain-containing protein [Kouleothrix sp.]